MYCPQCGQTPPTEQTRYCTHCGFALGLVKEILTTETLPGTARQRDITLGAGLMFIGATKAILLMLAFGGGRGEVFDIFAFATAAFFGLLQLFFQLSPRQKGMSLGATLMFLGAVAGLVAGTFTGGLGILAVLAIAIPMILFWKRLAAGFSKLFFDKPESAGSRALPSKPVAALPTPQTPAIDLNTDRIGQSARLSVVEGTTKNLGASGSPENLL